MNKMESKQEPGSKKNRMRDKNWQDEEKAILKNLVKKYIQDIENKKLDTDSNKRKYEAWKKICTSFNQQSKCGTRTINQLKIRWKLMKMMAKAKQTDNNCSKAIACESPTSFGDSNYSTDNTNESFSCDSYAVKMEPPEKVTVEVDIQEDTDMLVSSSVESEAEESQVLLNIDTRPPTKIEIARAIQSLKNGKAPGNDGIPVEAFKANADVSADVLFSLFQKIWEKEEVPESWKEGLIIKLPKKGDLTNCGNWRGINLLPTCLKILCKVLLHRMAAPIDEGLRKEQAGFRAGRSCTDQINLLRTVLEQCSEMQCEVFTLFVDFEKAFDRVKWSSIWKILKRKGIPEKIISMIRCLYTGSSCRVLHCGELTEPIPVTAGVKQGCLLSPLLFITVLDDVMRRATCESQRGLPWTQEQQLEDIDFADDLCLLSTKRQHLQSKIDDLAREAEKDGLRINCSKTKEMRLNTSDDCAVHVNGEAVERVNKFTYLGSVVDPHGGTEADIDARINKARSAFAQLKPVWDSSVIARRTKVRIFESNVMSVLLYGCETWFVRDDLECGGSSVGQILKVFWPRTISNTELWRLTNQRRIDSEIRPKKWSWIGHTLRRSEDHPPKIALTKWAASGKRKRGRPKTTWRRTVVQEAAALGMSWHEVEDQSDSDDSIPDTIRISKPSLRPIPSTNSLSEQAKLYMNHLVKSASTMQTKLYKLKTENAKKKEHILLMKREYWRIKLNSVGGKIPSTPQNDSL
ncbi:unnamed protein product [Plutella xylostella]|uniref:Regulatory protein zeste n=1 Tax=Plutella xylostella TaxID=51655 RepID=A0A8S4FQ53_PLUXY|nr:unnamed protein product [Plutella xylostella]